MQNICTAVDSIQDKISLYDGRSANELKHDVKQKKSRILIIIVFVCFTNVQPGISSIKKEKNISKRKDFFRHTSIKPIFLDIDELYS